MVVDEKKREEVGRPYLTVAIDKYSRCIVGMVVSFEAPSSVSVGLCLAHMVTDKRPYLAALGVDVEWPMSGKPLGIYVDNAAEFRSDALKRGCEQHGIELGFRPPGRPHYGGTVERVIGTLMKTVHELPGTTFSNPAERGKYPSQKNATLTLRELERWLVLEIARYHGSVHRSLVQTPAARWAGGLSEFGGTRVVVDPIAFLLDFLPVVHRKITREGFVIDHVHYFANVLNPWIARRASLPKFAIRRDPRDLSRVWVQDPQSHAFIEVPSRSLNQAPVALWEHKAALARQRADGMSGVDEAQLSRIVNEMQRVASEAVVSTRTSRRNVERKDRTPKRSATSAPEIPSADWARDSSITPYEDLEEW